MLRIERKFKYFLLNSLSKFFSPTKISPDEIDLKKIKNVLVIGQDRFGDCILSTPAIHALKTLIPYANIIYLAHGKYVDIILNNPDINEILVFDKKEKKNIFKFILDLRSKEIDLSIVLCTHPVKLTNAILSYISGAKIRVGYRSTYIKTDEIDESGMNKLFFNLYTDKLDSDKHEVEWNLRLIELLGFREIDFDKMPQIYLTDKEKETAENIINNLRVFANQIRLIGIHPLVPDGLKWGLNDYVELIDKIYKDKIGEVLLFWAPDEFKNIEFIIRNVENKPIVSSETKTIRELVILISKLNLFIGKDTASSHIASAFSIPSIVLFTGGVNVNQWRPWGNNNRLFTNESKFNVDDVFGAIKDLLNS